MTASAIVVHTARGMDDPRATNGLDNDPTEVEHLGLPTSHLELRKRQNVFKFLQLSPAVLGSSPLG